ncbi:hypothetical protein FE249_18455 (plasmid) [Acidiphilium multivorum]|uniref:hypothetical protein n=1 Tax=Acidiphilium TaxID=522 RepID=UPI00157A9ECF|nr:MULTISPECIES: hypothetical protein [Acidiphilium]UNC16230.1 hypothetical protein FE249_18455 [Acidiphilium multivorum]
MLARILAIMAPEMEREMGIEYQNTVGILHPDIPAKSAGRKVGEWKYSYPDIRQGGRPTIIPITILMTYRGRRASFAAISDQLPDDYEHSDINELHRLVFNALEDQARILTEVEWEEWLEITVQGATKNTLECQDRYSALLAGDLKIEVNRIKRGFHPETGLPLTVNSNGVALPFPEPTRLSAPQEQISGMRMLTPKERSYVPATPENIRILNGIIDRMEQLRTGLSDMLSHENVGNSHDIGEAPMDLLPSP